mmetsp:Transcript_13321/g.46272  ORF Transcript_13321/g.46272 Transcript_13321/m.46272 type:complete len:204 (+) Transcript_13321:1197-1808(+)
MRSAWSCAVLAVKKPAVFFELAFCAKMAPAARRALKAFSASALEMASSSSASDLGARAQRRPARSNAAVAAAIAAIAVTAARGAAVPSSVASSDAVCRARSSSLGWTYPWTIWMRGTAARSESAAAAVRHESPASPSRHSHEYGADVLLPTNESAIDFSKPSRVTAPEDRRHSDARPMWSAVNAAAASISCGSWTAAAPARAR